MKKPWTQSEADGLIKALTPTAEVFKFGVSLGQSVVPDPRMPETLTLNFKPEEDNATLGDNTVKLLGWMRDMWGKPCENVKQAFDPWSYVNRGDEAPPRRRNVQPPDEPVQRRAGGAGALIPERIRAAAQRRIVDEDAPQNGWAVGGELAEDNLQNNLGGGQIGGINPPQRALGVNMFLRGDGRWEDENGRIINVIPGGGAPVLAEEALGAGKPKKDPIRFKYGFMRNDAGIIYIVIF